MANKKISELPYINVTKISGNTLVPLVTYFSAATGDTVHTYANDLKSFITSGISVSGNYLPLSGGTVSGGTRFLSGLTANTISATTYFNLPSSTFSGGTVTGPTIFTNGLTANTISATTYQNLPTDIRVTGATYSNNTFTYKNNTGGTFSTLFNTVTGLTVNGGLTITGNTSSQGLTATTISATTYQNLPTDIRVTGGTYSAGTISFTNNTGGTFNVTGLTTGSTSTVSGNFLPLSGGTVTGGTIFTSGVTANTISNTTYIDFTTGSTNPSAVGGRMFFDNTSKSLSYYDIIGNNVPIAMGQQLYVRGNNATGSQINKGSVVMVTGTTNTLPSIVLATNNHTQGSPRPIGLAAENIPSGNDGLVIVNGILSGITLNTFANGTTLYLSDTTPGGYVGSTSSLNFSARTNEIGYVLQTGTTTGKIYVNINNEDSNLTLTDIERNIIEGNVISTGVYEFTGTTVASPTTINVAPARGWIVNNTYNFATLPDVTNLYYSGGTGITITNIATADATYILLTSASTITQQTTFPTPQQRRENILLGKVVHPSRTSILNVNNTVDFDVSPMSALRDLWTPIRLINQGVIPSANTGLTINTTAGTLWGNGVGWVSNQLNPDSVSISAKTPASFFYRTQTGGTSGSVSVIDPTKYDVGGVITSMGGAGADDSSNQRIYLYPTGVINILYGQHKYTNLAAAVAAIQSETFVVYPNAETTGILIGVLSVRNDIVADGEALTNTDYAKFTLVSKFGESFGGTGGLSTTTLQQAYDNSTTPEITTNSTLGPLSVKNGAGTLDNVTNVFEGVNATGTTTSIIRADGLISGSTISTPSFTANTNGVTTTTISATTYQNLPTDIRVTGATNSNNTFTFTNNTGGTFSTIFNTVTGLTINGNLTVTGNTSLQSLTATTISATTYTNLPTDVRVTGATYSNNTFTFTNNTGGTFNTLFNTVTGLTVNGGLTVTGNTSLQSLTATTTTVNGNLTVTGNTNIKAFTGTTGYISGSGQNILTVIGSGNSTTSPLFTVQGSSGELFSVNDSLVGSLFSVNDISGLPILEVFSDNTTLMGSYQAPSLNTTTKVTLTAGTNTVYSIPTSAYTGAFIDYTLVSTGTTGARAGNIMTIWSGSTAQYTETSTNDIGNTAGVTFSVAVSGSNAVLSSSATTTGWALKTIIRSI
jgi:hypothetical protein